jgi:hypothetical protein
MSINGPDLGLCFHRPNNDSVVHKAGALKSLKLHHAYSGQIWGRKFGENLLWRYPLDWLCHYQLSFGDLQRFEPLKSWIVMSQHPHGICRQGEIWSIWSTVAQRNPSNWISHWPILSQPHQYPSGTWVHTNGRRFLHSGLTGGHLGAEPKQEASIRSYHVILTTNNHVYKRYTTSNQSKWYFILLLFLGPVIQGLRFLHLFSPKFELRSLYC